MLFWKKFLLVVCFMGTMYFGGICVQSDSTLFQGLGFIVIIFSMIILYAVAKVMWQGMEFLPAFLIIGSLIVYILYCLGFIGGGQVKPIQHNDSAIEEIGAEDIATAEDVEENQPENIKIDETNADKVSPEANTNHGANGLPLPPAVETPQNQITPSSSDSSSGIMGKIKSFFGEAEEENPETNLNPTEYPFVEGYVSVATGSVVQMEGLYIHMYGIDAPDPQQLCADQNGSQYKCGIKSLNWLEDWINGRILRCHLLTRIIRGHVTGVCFADNGKYDVAAAVVNAGWALAYTPRTNVYAPYERQAKYARRGLWRGRFYRPWEWRQKQKVNVTISKPGGLKGWFSGLF